MGRDEEHPLLVPEKVLRAVAVMDIEIDDRDPGEAAPLERVLRGDGDIAEDAEPHGRLGLGVMSRRPASHEGRPGLPVEHGIDGRDGAPDATERRLERAGRHVRIAVEGDRARCRRGRPDPVEIAPRVTEKHVVVGSLRRLPARETQRRQRILHRLQSRHLFRMAARHHVLEAGRMGIPDHAHGVPFAADLQPNRSGGGTERDAAIGVRTGCSSGALSAEPATRISP